MANITEDGLRAYINRFHDSLDATASRFLTPEEKAALVHMAVLPAKIVGYVSTQFGAGVEYLPAPSTSIEIVRGSARVEELFVQAPPAAKNVGPMFLFQEGSGDFLNATWFF